MIQFLLSTTGEVCNSKNFNLSFLPAQLQLKCEVHSSRQAGLHSLILKDHFISSITLQAWTSKVIKHSPLKSLMQLQVCNSVVILGSHQRSLTIV